MEQTSRVTRADFLDAWGAVEEELTHIRLDAATVDDFGSTKRAPTKGRSQR